MALQELSAYFDSNEIIHLKDDFVQEYSVVLHYDSNHDRNKNVRLFKSELIWKPEDFKMLARHRHRAVVYIPANCHGSVVVSFAPGGGVQVPVYCKDLSQRGRDFGDMHSRSVQENAATLEDLKTLSKMFGHDEMFMRVMRQNLDLMEDVVYGRER